MTKPAADDACAYQSVCRPEGLLNATHVQAQRPIDRSAKERVSARRAVRSAKKAARSAAADVFAAAYQSECRPGGPYGAL